MMKRVVFEFLNVRFEDILVYHQVFNLHNRRIERFVTHDYEDIIEFTYFSSGKEKRFHLNNRLLKHVQKYINDIHPIDVEMYVLEWCYDKKYSTVEM